MMQASSSTLPAKQKYWPSARQFTEAIQCPPVCFAEPLLKGTLPAVDRLGMPLVTSGQFAYVYKLKSSGRDFAVRCFRGYLGDRDQRYRAIERHLRNHPVPALSDFQYGPEGILVGENRFPILFMEWIEGPTLDLYLDEMVERKEVMLHLSHEWVKLIAALREAGVAHGDLQHGNIIIEHGNLRLIDHDGLFVPEMSQWSSSEVGHQHYQHPKRDAQHFDRSLDHFSSIVIYLTLIALAERPDLWREHHDENLLFTRADFLDPASSSLFAHIRAIGPQQRRLADVLATAANGHPESVPCLLDLVDVKSSLPSWMTAPVDLESRTKTREVKIDPALRKEHPRWIPWTARAKYPSVPATPPSSTVQTLFGGPAAPALASQTSRIKDPLAVWKNTPVLAKEMLGRNFILWYWGLYVFLTMFGVNFFSSLAIGLLCAAISCLIVGFIRAQQVARAAMHAKVSASNTPPLQFSPTGHVLAAPKPVFLPRPLSITHKDPLVGNAALNIYHLPGCDWVKQIPDKNRTTFSSSVDASQAGYKPCQVCSPSP